MISTTIVRDIFEKSPIIQISNYTFINKITLLNIIIASL